MHEDLVYVDLDKAQVMEGAGPSAVALPEHWHRKVSLKSE